MTFDYWIRGDACLIAAIKRFLNGKILMGEELDLIKDYVIKWIECISILSPHFPANFKEAIGSLKDGKTLMKYVGEELLPIGIDPF